jgi:hypothetical protein
MILLFFACYGRTLCWFVCGQHRPPSLAMVEHYVGLSVDSTVLQLASLKQTHTVAEYHARFRIYASSLEWG